MGDSSIELAVKDPTQFAVYFAERLLARLESGGGQELEWVAQETSDRYSNVSRSYQAIVEGDPDTFLVSVTHAESRYDSFCKIEVSRLFTVAEADGRIARQFHQLGQASSKGPEEAIVRLYTTVHERNPAQLENWRYAAAAEFFGL